MAETMIHAGAEAGTEAQVRRIGLGDLGVALRRGWEDFLAAPTQLAFLGILYPVVGLLAATLSSGGEVIHLLYPMAAGFALVGPIAALGLYEISRRRERGEPARWKDAFRVFGSPAIGPILLLGLGLLAVFVAWLWAAHAIFAGTIGRLPSGIPLGEALFGTAEGWRLVWLGNLVGFAFAAFVLVTTAISFPMLLDRDGGVGPAVATSVRAFVRNPVPMAAWGLVVAALVVLGSIPLLIGLAVVVPVLGHATWHLYRLVVS